MLDWNSYNKNTCNIFQSFSHRQKIERNCTTLFSGISSAYSMALFLTTWPSKPCFLWIFYKVEKLLRSKEQWRLFMIVNWPKEMLTYVFVQMSKSLNTLLCSLCRKNTNHRWTYIYSFIYLQNIKSWSMYQCYIVISNNVIMNETFLFPYNPFRNIYLPSLLKNFLKTSEVKSSSA